MMTRRTALALAAASALPSSLLKQSRAADLSGIDLARGPFDGTRESLRTYRCPEWFRDAKFGIWAHWGPQSAAEYGDWYARNMYIEGSRQYKYHVQRYGHPSKFGFKDIIPTWHGDQFDPAHLVSLYKKAGAKYFVSMGVHHDNFDLWNSRHTRWNAVNMGPKKDIVGMFRKAALDNGLKFGVSDHLWISYKWFAVSHGADKTGPLAGVPYDGADPQYAGLYHDVDFKQIGEKLDWNEDKIPDSWRRAWLLRIKDLADRYRPDLLYSDGPIPFEEYGLALVANLYNRNAQDHGGRAEAVYTSKRREDSETGTCVLDVERGVVDGVWPRPWQTDTCVGHWHYDKTAKYKSPKMVIDMLVDVVSRNGNLLLNFPLPNSGALDPEELNILAAITRWMSVNSEGIYATRPWKVCGEGPNLTVPATGTFNEKDRKQLGSDDVRFTTKDGKLYAFVMGWPEGQCTLRSLAIAGQQAPFKVTNVELLGFDGKLTWSQQPDGLQISLPAQRPSDHAVAFRITSA